MNNPDDISESLKIIFFGVECGSEIRDGKIRIRDKHPGSASLVSISESDRIWDFLIRIVPLFVP
jgi:hypothetical protein